MEVSEARRLKDLESENAWLKKLLAEAMFDMEALKVVVKGKPRAHKPNAKQWRRFGRRSISPNAAGSVTTDCMRWWSAKAFTRTIIGCIASIVMRDWRSDAAGATE